MVRSQRFKQSLGAFQNRLSKLSRSSSGVTAVITAITVPLIIGFAALAVDLSYYQYLKLRLEASTDTTALHLAAQGSVTRSFSVRDATVNSLSAEIPTAISIGVKNLPENNANSAIIPTDIAVGEWNFGTGTFSSVPPFRLINAVRVTGELSVERGNGPPQFFSKFLGRETTIKTTSFAHIPPVPNIHVLDRSERRSFSLTGGSDIDSIDAWVNSSAADAVYLNPTRRAAWGGAGIFTPGGVVLRGRAGGLADRMIANMYVLGDLLAETDDPDFTTCVQVRASEDFGSCATHRYHVVDEAGSVELYPGIYRGGLEIKNSGTVTLNPGVYVMAGGPFKTSGTPRITGENVMIYFTGNNAKLEHGGGVLALRGRDTGLYQGFVMYGDRETTEDEEHEINSGMNFVGTIYFPTADLSITGAIMDGSCHSLCIVSRNFNAHNSFLNVYPGQNVTGFGKIVNFPAPLELIPALLPVLTLEAL